MPERPSAYIELYDRCCAEVKRKLLNGNVSHLSRGSDILNFKWISNTVLYNKTFRRRLHETGTK